MNISKRLFICLRRLTDECDDFLPYCGGKIIVADNEDEACNLFMTYENLNGDELGHVRLQICKDDTPPAVIIDVTDKLSTSTVLYDDGYR